MDTRVSLVPEIMRLVILLALGAGLIPQAKSVDFGGESDLGDFVWADSNRNGVQDLEEPGISGVVVQLLDCAGNFLRETNTDSNGRYLFANLQSGSYRLAFIAPDGLTFTTQDQPGDSRDSDADPVTGLTPCYTLFGGQNNRTVDAGLVSPPRVSIGDFVWQDLNANGVQDAGEPGLANVVVKLMNCAGELLGTTNTDANGFYLFNNHSPGNYRLIFVPPPCYVFTAGNGGADDSRDSDANSITGLTACYSMLGGETNRTVDAGLQAMRPIIRTVTRHDASLIIEWDGAPNLKLQRTPALRPSAWTDVPGSAGQSRMEIPIDGPQAFFRLACL